MSLEVYTLEQSEQWDKIVRSFKNYDAYWLSGYVKAFEINGDGVPLLFYYNDISTRGINVVMKRDIAKDKHFQGLITEDAMYDFATPYGYGGWIIDGLNTETLFDSYCKWCLDNNIVSEFVRFHPVIENHIFSENNYEVVPLGNTVALNLESPDVIWANITSKNRNMIRKAQKNEIKIYYGNYPQIYDIFREIYNATMDKDHATDYYYFSKAFYDSILYDLPNNAQVFYAVYQDKVIAASIMLFANGKINYHLSGSLREYSNLAPTNLILYRAALWGSENHCKTFYLGGGVGSGEDSLFKFKKAFYRKDDLKRFYIGKKIYNRDKYNELMYLRGEVFGDYFPEYRA